MKKVYRTSVLLSLATLCLINTAEANYPIYQISYLVNFPSTAVFRTMGIGFLVIVVIEALVLKKLEKLRFIKALCYALLTNFFSTALGAVSYPGSSAMMIFPMILIGSGFLSGMVKAIAVHGQYEATKRLRLCPFMTFFALLALGLLTIKLIPLTIPGGKGLLHAERLYFNNNFEVFTAVISGFGLLAIGYLISVISEGYIFTKLFPKGQRILKTVLKMNFFSYLALIIILTPNIRTVIQEKSWWFHQPQRYTMSGDFKKEGSLVLYESVIGEWGSVIDSSVNALESLDYKIKRIWPDDKFQKRFKEIETQYSSLDKTKREMNFPTSIQLNVSRENEQTNDLKLEIILNGYETDDEYFPDLNKHGDSGCLSGPVKEALTKAFAKNNFPQDALKCISGRWTKSK